MQKEREHHRQTRASERLVRPIGKLEDLRRDEGEESAQEQTDQEYSRDPPGRWPGVVTAASRQP